MATLIELGQEIPEIRSADLHGEMRSSQEARGKVLVLIFWSAECPWSERADEYISSWREEWGERVVVWMIASNSNETPADMLKVAQDRKLGTVLLDDALSLADQFGALTTPHCYLIDPEGVLRYRGAIDDVTFRQREPTRFFLKEAVDALLFEGVIDPVETPGYGCTIVRIKPEGD